MTTLNRAIGLPAATALVVGTIIGSSIFVQASEIALLVPHRGAILLAWAVAGVLTLIGALVCAELSSAYPKTGGVYVFLREIYSPSLGFLWGWAMLWTMHSGILAAIATVFARYAGVFVPLNDVTTRAVAIAAIIVLSAINFLGVKFGSRVQAGFTLVKVIAVVTIIAIGFLFYPGAAPAIEPQVVEQPVGLANFFLAVGAGLFAYGGWHMVTYTAEETLNPTRTIPRSLMIGVAVVTLCYIGLNLVYTLNLPMQAVMSSTRIAADTFEVLLGPQAAGAISALVMFSAFGALNGIVLVGPRVYYQMSQDGLWFKWASHLHPGVPHAGPRDHPASRGRLRAGRHRQLSCALHAGDLHRVDLLRAARVRRHPAAPPAGLCAGLAHAARANRAVAVRDRSRC